MTYIHAFEAVDWALSSNHFMMDEIKKQLHLRLGLCKYFLIRRI